MAVFFLHQTLHRVDFFCFNLSCISFPLNFTTSPPWTLCYCYLSFFNSSCDILKEANFSQGNAHKNVKKKIRKKSISLRWSHLLHSKSSMVNLKMVWSIIATRCHPPAKLPLFLSYAQPFKINKKRNRILGKIKKRRSQLAVYWNCCWCIWLWLPTHSPCGVPQARSRHRTYLSQHEMRATCHKMLPPCLTHCKSTFHSMLLSWNSHAVLISYTSCHDTLPPQWNLTKPFSLLFHFLGELPLWNCPLIPCHAGWWQLRTSFHFLYYISFCVS